MRSIEVVRYKHRLDHLFRKGAGFSDDAEMQSHWARYLCILVSGFLEVGIREAYGQYARNKSAQYVANYVEGRLEFFQNPKMSKILELTRAFSPEWADSLEDATKDEYKAAVDSIVANRNRLAHGDDVGLTYVRVKEYYERVQKVVEIIENQCSA